MPRNRRPRDRDEKRQEIVDAAAALFTELGFEKTSMTRIAQAAGVTPNTIYWYVDDKDALLVAVLDHLMTQALEQLAEQPRLNLIDQVLWAIGRLQRHHKLINVVHTRSEQSPVVAAWHDQFHAAMDDTVMRGLARQGVAERHLGTLARLTTFAVEGLLAHPTDEDDTRALLASILDRHSMDDGAGD